MEVKMSDEINKSLVWRLEQCSRFPSSTWVTGELDTALKDAVALIEQQAARIAELEALLVKANDAWLAMSGIAAPVADSAMAKDAEPIWCQACGDGITAHDPGICGTCFAVKYRDAASLPETPSPEMILAALAVQWPALYKDGLNTEHDGESLRAQTAQRVEIVRRQYRAMVEAMEKEQTNE
jgi:hypothetical protein